MEFYKNFSLDNIEYVDINGKFCTEKWKSIFGDDGYKIRDLGRIKSSKKSKKILKQFINKSGYLVSSIIIKNKQKTYLVSRLVAIHFIKNDGLLEVNHKNGIKIDNRSINLEWCTRSQNIKHLYDKLGQKGFFLGKFGENHNRSKPIIQLDINGNFIKKWGSGGLIQKTLGYYNPNINKCCHGKKKQYKGFIWKFEENYK